MEQIHFRYNCKLFANIISLPLNFSIVESASPIVALKAFYAHLLQCKQINITISLCWQLLALAKKRMHSA